MLRRLIIACGTLGLILVAFGLYRSQNTPPEKPLPSLPEVTVGTASAPASQEAVNWIKDLRIAPGKEASFEVFDQKSGQLQYLMKWAEWKAQNENKVDLIKPELWKFMRNGQVLRIAADTGQITVEPVGKSNFKPKRGWLRKNVRISIDMSSRAWREAHPERDAMEQHPEHVMAIEMDSLYFDDDLSLIRTEEAVRVHSNRFDIASTGLTMIYSRPADRLENLVLSKDGTIVLRGDLDWNQKPAGTSSARPARASAPASLATATSSAPASQAAPAKYQDIYKAVFEGPVNVQQYREDKLVARLDSDKVLELVFDMAQQERQGEEEPEKALPAFGPGQQAASVETGERTVLTWAGALRIDWIERNRLEHATRTTQIKALGDNVTLEDVETGNTITCQQLDYDVIGRSGRIAAEAPIPARLVDSRGGYLAGQDIRFDQAQGMLEIDGPGEASEPASAGQAAAAASRPNEDATKIHWTEHLLVRFRQVQLPMPVSVIPLNMPARSAVMERLNRQTIFEMRTPVRRAASLTGNPLEGLTAETAIITGDALVQRGPETLRAQKLTIGFAGGATGKTFGAIQSALGEGTVRLVSKDQAISADSLDVDFEPAEGGRSAPNRAIAQGHAVAKQGTAEIAADFLDAILKQVPVDARGDDAGGKTRPAVVTMTAAGNVRINDPQQQNLDVRGDAVKAEAPNGRQVKDLTVKGTPAAPASVRMGEFALEGATIQADLQTQDTLLPSAGKLELPVRQGPEGTRLEKPRTMVITWTDRMQMWGGRNQALFEGDVRAIMASRKDAAGTTDAQASGEDTAVTADRMRVYFRAIAQTAEPEPAAGSSPAAQVMEKAREQIAQVMPGASDWLPSPRQASRRNRLGGEAAVQREPVKVIAEGNAKAISSRYDASGEILTSRLLITGPVFLADLTRQHLEVDGAGKLLLENYALARTAAKLLAAGRDLTTQPVKNIPEDGLSQTVFAWTNAMTFSLDDQLAVFDEAVNMVHRSGSKVVLGGQLTQALGANVSLLQVMPGRIATLNSDNLVVQFAEPADKKASQEAAAADQWLRRADLEVMIATGNVYLNEEFSNGGSNFLTAGRVQYSGQRDTFTVQGTPGAQGSRGIPANLVRQQDAHSAPVPTTLDAFLWNRRTGEISARGVRGQGFQ
jgi:hypothetical protein